MNTTGPNEENPNRDAPPRLLTTPRILVVLFGISLVFVIWSFRVARPLSLAEKIRLASRSETILEQLSPSLSKVSKFLGDRTIAIDSICSTPFSIQGQPEVSFDQLLKVAQVTAKNTNGVTWRQVDLPASSSARPTDLWAGLTGGTNLQDAHMGVLETKLISDAEFQIKTQMEGRAATENDGVVGFLALQTLTWKKLASAPGDKTIWKLARWQQDELRFVTGTPMFQDVTEQAVPDNPSRSTLLSSSHQKILLERAKESQGVLQDVSFEYGDFNDWESAFQYPAVSVVDWNGDGHDDLFVTDRWQPAQLLQNRGDGTFVDVTESSGLDVPELACCALFADFDNDGDADAFIGRTLKPSLFFENRDGKFVLDPSAQPALEYARFVVSATAVDINRDGLLDLHLCTYGFSAEESFWRRGWIHPDDVIEMENRARGGNWYVNRGGPTNIILMNHNGQLKRAKLEAPIRQFRNTYQSAWLDVDQDGDLDVYLCNDFAPDVFLKNETPQGSFELRFREASEETFREGTMGFGMGASIGDYNNDGLLDLYISNMYSKAGNRIVKQIDEVDERIKVSARGNFLFENTGQQFRQVAGLGADDQQVSKVGWSFGGQFADFNNDGQLDVYVPSGYYTPPAEIEQSGDL